jgi:hypothetical protein
MAALSLEIFKAVLTWSSVIFSLLWMSIHRRPRTKLAE